MDLNATRNQLKQRRRELGPQQQSQSSKAVVERIQSHQLFLNAKNIGSYWPNQGEIDLRGLSVRSTQILHLPVLREGVYPWAGKGLLFSRANQPLLKNRYGIPEPVGSEYVLAAQLDYILVPLVGFDRQGNRLGMGGGYYDRALATANTTFKLGVAHSFQEVPEIKSNNWDVPLDGVVTENELIIV